MANSPQSRECQEKRHGMYAKDAVCGDLATAVIDGIPVCEVHARRRSYSPAMCPHGGNWGFGECSQCDAGAESKRRP